jgi:hypothetical protein
MGERRQDAECSGVIQDRMLQKAHRKEQEFITKKTRNSIPINPTRTVQLTNALKEQITIFSDV